MAKKKTTDTVTEPVIDELPGEDITPDDSIVPVYLVPLTAEEEAEREQWALEQIEREQAEANKLAARESARAKLAKLGLTDEEINALSGGI